MDSKDTQSETNLTPSRKHWWQFSLRSMLLFMLISGCGFAIYSYFLHYKYLCEKAERQCEQVGGKLTWDQDDPHWAKISFPGSWSPEVPEGINFEPILQTLCRLRAVSIDSTNSDLTLTGIKTLNNLRHLQIWGEKHDRNQLLAVADLPNLLYVDIGAWQSDPSVLEELKQLRPEMTVTSPKEWKPTCDYHEGVIARYHPRGGIMWKTAIAPNADLSIDPTKIAMFSIGSKLSYFHSRILLFLDDQICLLTDDGELLWKRSMPGGYDLAQVPEVGRLSTVLCFFEPNQTLKDQPEHATDLDHYPKGRLHCLDMETGETIFRSTQELNQLVGSGFHFGDLVIFTGWIGSWELYDQHPNYEITNHTYFLNRDGSLKSERSEYVYAFHQHKDEWFLASDQRLAKYTRTGNELWSVPLDWIKEICSELFFHPREELCFGLFLGSDPSEPQEVTLACFKTTNGELCWKHEFTATQPDRPLLYYNFREVTDVELDGNGDIAIILEEHRDRIYKYNSINGELLWKWE